MTSRKIIPDHVSPFRSMDAEREGTRYESVPSLAEALMRQDYALIMEGDYGGQIYATCPVELVVCDVKALSQLLFDIDSIQNNMFGGCHNFFEYAPVDSHIAAGMGGAEITSGVWCHDKLVAIDMARSVVDVLMGRSPILVVPTNDELERKAKFGDVKAQYFLARQYFKTDRSKSLDWYAVAARNGHLQSMSWLSIHQKVQLSERMYWLRKLASLSDLEPVVQSAQFRLAAAFDEGNEIERDPAAAVKLYEQCCKNRHSPGTAIRLAEMYFNGDGVATNYQRALAWLLVERNGRSNQLRQAPPSRKMTTEADFLYQQLRMKLSPQAIAEAETLMKDLQN